MPQGAAFQHAELVEQKVSLVAARDARGFCPYWRVIECELLSGLNMRRFQKPRADMVISGSGPNLGSDMSFRS
jgi:hypothetical protein